MKPGSLLLGCALAILMSLLVRNSCTAAGGVLRGSYSDWEVVNDDALGISFEVPKDRAVDIESPRALGRLWAGRLINFHKIRGSDPLTDALSEHFVIGVVIARFESDDYSKFVKKKGGFMYPAVPGKLQIYHPKLREYRDSLSPAKLYRRDVRGPGGSIIVAYVNWLDLPPNRPFEKEDDAAIKRILNSIKVLKSN